MFKKLLSAVIALTMLLSAIPAAFAESSFTDVISPDYDWAMDDIEKMTTLGIIKGYTDKTFRPANTIKRIEMLLLLSRAAGYSNEEYADFIDYADSLYASVLDEYDLGSSYNKYKSEVAFLLYKGILSTDELDTYLDDADSTVKRYEAAILLTKLMGAEDEVKKNTAVVLNYADYTEIPVSARAYVEYVTAQGLMNGIEDNNFGPNEDVTRVQVTILLSRIIDKLDLSFERGTVKDVDTSNGTVSVYNEETKKTETYTINSAAVTVLKDGFSAGLADIAEDSEAIVVYHGSSIASVEFLSPATEDETVVGKLSDVTVKTNYTRFNVIDSKTGSTRSFLILASAEPEITYNGKDVAFSKLSSGDTVTVTVEGGAVTSIAAEGGNKTVKGIVSDITLSPDYLLTVRVSDDNGTTTDETEEFSVDDDVTVTRNGSKSSLRSVLSGDSVTLSVESGVVTKIVATSKSANTSGTISSIYISTSPEIGVKTDGEEHVYSVSSDATYTVDGDEATIYDLRLGASVDVALEGNSIVSVDAEASSATYQKYGVIEDVNTSYGFINLDIDGDTEQIFISKSGSSVKTNILDSVTGEKVSFSKLKSGQTITAVGAYSNGTFVATTILVIE